MTEKYSLLIVEDDQKLREMLTEYFEDKEFHVTSLAEGSNASDVINTLQPDLLLLDLMLPGDDGLTICRQIRSIYKGKILMLTASDDDFDHVAALEIGADDFVTKPIKPRVLLARMRMLLRRQEVQTSQPIKGTLEYGKLTLNQSRHICELNGEAIAMTDSEFDLLWLLASEPDQVLSRDILTKALRGIEYDGIDRTVDNKIVLLRKKLGDDSSPPKRIITVRGKGYLFVPDTW
ncbi:response regulator [Vibrio aestuarianus]|uniref:DNA-binding transcriptional regulator RstA n=1 Tax=Vibrio aestuarianus TaxID=28171 RepID=A0A7X6S6N3_9VIBR|nr:response regulator [Vibrio aestuarianus]KOE82523.1 chemotaxis protein CheY [Vibrio alginolyticus]MDE1213020.1 response regulator [Vibrio aestuarianus]MDE1216996.1 response regulator [Vibrio aestuarianus]MDE1219470.1 response regulator [Vibrio aestuarianus]MDE1224216.1 response regulator [Vibrio aestuarianus]